MIAGKKLFLFFSALIVLSISCSKTSTTTVTPTPTSIVGTLSCKVNGAAFDSYFVSANYQYIQLMVVSSAFDNLTKVDLTAIVSAKVGTYDLKNSANYLSNKVLHPAVYGTLNLTKFDATLHLVSGAFSYTTNDSTKISEGIFTDLKY